MKLRKFVDWDFWFLLLLRFMARRQLSSATRRLEQLLWGSGRCQKALACWERNVPTANLCPQPRLNAAGGQWGEFDIALSRIVFGHSRSLHNRRDKRTDQKRIVEMLWRDLFSDPSQWWDHRSEKVNARYPDFKHKKTREALWLDGKLNPSWVERELATLSPGTIQADGFSWNARLARLVKAEKNGKAMELFKQMHQDGIHPDRLTFIHVLKACANLQALKEGRIIHAQIMQSGYELDLYICSSLLSMYTKCGSMEEAQQVFNKMPTRNAVTWNIMILGYVKCGQANKALEISRQMQWEGVEPDPFTYVASLNACASVRALEEGKILHGEIIERRWHSNVYVGSSLIDMYAKCGSITAALKVFKRMRVRDVVAWSAMIQGYAKCGHGNEALKLAKEMQQEGLLPDHSTYVGILNACASVAALEEGRRVHEQIIQNGYETNAYVVSSLIDMYAKCGSIADAQRVFDMMPTRDVVSWNAMILGYGNCGQGRTALELSRRMARERLEPTPATFLGVLNACASLGDLEEGRRAHEKIIQRGCEADIFMSTSLIDMYAKCGSIKDALRVFKKTPTTNVVSWNAMIQGYVKCGKGRKAVELYHRMQHEGVQPDPVTFVVVLNACASLAALEEGRHIHAQIIQKGCKSDTFVSNSLIDMYAKCDSMEDAQRVFNEIPTRDVVAWSAIILGYVKSGQVLMALKLARQMQQEGVEPNPVIFVGLLNACASVAALQEGRRIHEQVPQSDCDSDLSVGNSLISMYAKCGSVEDAYKVFSEMPVQNVTSWNVMLGAYAMHGDGKAALDHFQQMCHGGVEITTVTFVSLLSACSRAGLVDEGLHYFESMNSVYSIPPAAEHYACVVELLGRSGRLQEAEDLISRMSVKLDATVWMSLLGACRAYSNVELAEEIAKRVLTLDPGNASAYVLLSNIYAGASRWDSRAKIQQLRLERGVMKQPGRTWIEVNNELHFFTVGDDEHPQMAEIWEKLESLSWQLKESGYVPDTALVLHDVDEEEELSLLGRHSEKLAIAFGLISTPPGTPLLIVKNFRVCRDCHSAMKFIAKICGRSVIVREANRFHHFKDGLCSCRDSW